MTEFFPKKGCENLTRLIEQENLLDKEVKDYQKIVLFTPTWRNWDGKVDGTLKPDLMNLDDYHDQKFKEYTRENKILFIVKLHPFEEAHYSQIIADKEDMVLITSKMLQDNLMDLYDIIGGVDILITDYSSFTSIFYFWIAQSFSYQLIWQNMKNQGDSYLIPTISGLLDLKYLNFPNF